MKQVYKISIIITLLILNIVAYTLAMSKSDETTSETMSSKTTATETFKIEHPPFMTKEPDMSNVNVLFQFNEFKIPDEVFIHQYGFEVGKTTYRQQPDEEVAHLDEHGRVEKVTLNYTKDTITTLTNASIETPFIAHKLTATGKTYKVASSTWNDNLKPYLEALFNFVKQHDINLAVVYNFEYKNETDVYPEYIKLRAFSKNDFGKSLSINVTFHQFVKDKPLDFVTGKFMTSETMPTPTEVTP